MQTDQNTPRIKAIIIIWNSMMTMIVSSVVIATIVLANRRGIASVAPFLLVTIPLLVGMLLTRGSRRNDTLAVVANPEDERQEALRHRAKSFASTCLVSYAMVCLSLTGWLMAFSGASWVISPIEAVQYFMAGLLWVHMIAFLGGSWFFSRRS